MDSKFDPYYEWLGISPCERPVDHYTLLGLRRFEANPTVIANAADRQMAFLRTMACGPHSDACQQLMSEVEIARRCLLIAASRIQYDEQLFADSAPPIVGSMSDSPPDVLPIGRNESAIAPTLTWLTTTQALSLLVVSIVCAALGLYVWGRLAVATVASVPKHSSTPRADEVPSKVSRLAKAPDQPESDSMLNSSEEPAQESRSFLEGTVAVVQADPGVRSAEVASGLGEDEPRLQIAQDRDPPPDVSKTPDAPGRLEIPDGPALVAAERLVRQTFAKEYAAAKTAGTKASLATKLLTTGIATRDDVPGRYVLFRSAARIATDAGDIETAFRATDELVRYFDIDSVARKAQLLKDVLPKLPTAERRSSAAVRLGEVLSEAWSADRYEEMTELLAAVQRHFPTGLEVAGKTISVWKEEVGNASNRLKPAAEARKVLETRPNDPVAAGTLGTFLVMIKGDWNSGLPWLAASDSELKTLARMDLDAGNDPTKLVAAADAWWDYAHVLDRAGKRNVMSRAALLYDQSLSKLSGLSKARVSKRLSDLASQDIFPRSTQGVTRSADISKGRTGDVNSLGMELVLVEPGEFRMGSRQAPDTLAKMFGMKATEFAREMPTHAVRITKPFRVAKHEVTVAQFRTFAEATGYKTKAEVNSQRQPNRAPSGRGGDASSRNWRTPGFLQDDNHPVVFVSWFDAIEFCKWLSMKERATYRLPTEAEWEFFARAGAVNSYYSGDAVEDLKPIANVADLSLKKIDPSAEATVSWDDGFGWTSPVGRFQPNSLGIFDVTGNVWEWCLDCDGRVYSNSPVDDPRGPEGGRTKVVRGGSFQDGAHHQRLSRRGGLPPDETHVNQGFRVLREVDAR